MLDISDYPQAQLEKESWEKIITTLEDVDKDKREEIIQAFISWQDNFFGLFGQINNDLFSTLQQRSQMMDEKEVSSVN